MARRRSRRSSRRRSRRRSSRRRRSRRNPRYVVANRRRRSRRSSRRRGSRRRSSRRRGTRRNTRYATANRRRRRVRRNQGVFGTDIMRGVVLPVLGGTAGFVIARVAGNWLAMQPTLPVVGGKPRIGKTAAALAGMGATFAVARRSPGMVRRHEGALVLGMGLAAAESWLRDAPLLGGGKRAAALDETERSMTPSDEQDIAERSLDAGNGGGGDGLSAYYTSGMLGLGTGFDVSHAGAPYKGMLGLGANDDPDWGDQATVDSAMTSMENGSSGGMEATSTVTPTDLAMPAREWSSVRPVSERFAQGDRGHAGGLFARHLFSGMLGG